MMASPARKVLITGGLGYLGGRIAAHLHSCAPEFSVMLMNRRPQSQLPQWAESFETVQADVLDDTSLAEAVQGVDTVIHLAALNEIDSQSDPDLALEVNAQGTLRLLRACRKQSVQRFLYFSTFHVYGPGAAQPITEETPTRPIHPYSITHRLAEDFVNWYKHDHGMNTLILRLSNGYGYPADGSVQRWTLVFNDLCRQAVEHREIRLRSQGGQHRDFVALSDVARGVRHLLQLPVESWGDGLFNFGGDCSLSILQVAQRVASEFSERYGQDVPVKTGEAQDPQGLGPVSYSIDKLKQTGFSLVGDMSAEIQGTFDVCNRLGPQTRQVG